MFALRIEYLTGRCVATSYNDRRTAEWPPHPARILSALIATWADSDQPDEEERSAIDWLAEQQAPSLVVSDATRRQIVPHFVPVNDTTVLSDFGSAERRIDDLVVALTAAEAEHSRGSGGDKKLQSATKRSVDKLRGQIEKQRQSLRQRQKLDLAPTDNPSPVEVAKSSTMLPERRARQPRTFPSVTPLDPVAYLVWGSPPALNLRTALDSIASRVVRIGHSSSLVACRFVDDAPEPTLVPRSDGPDVLRVGGPGHVTRLIDAYARHREVEPRVLPSRFQRYGIPVATVEPESVASTFSDEWTVFRQISGPKLSTTLTVAVASAFHDALMSYADQPPAEVLSGHQENGDRSVTPHMAVLALPFVGSVHATGSILGIAVVPPRAATEEERMAILRALGTWEQNVRKRLDEHDIEAPPLEIRLGARGVLELERVVWGASPLVNLRSETWCGAARRWISVTPVALDRNPGNLYAADPRTAAEAWESAGRIIATACQRIGLQPARVEVLPSVTMSGVAKARAFGPFPSAPQRTRRVKVHAYLEFEVPVRGPVVLGAGRYYGLGLFRPLTDNREEA